jgi:hypothetical protein
MSEIQDKPVYEAPKVLKLERGDAAIGDCTTGSSDAVCYSHGNAAANCSSDGSSATSPCNSNGSDAETCDATGNSAG